MKKLAKRSLSALLVAVLLLAVFPVALPADAASRSSLTFEVNNKVAMVTDCKTSAKGKLTIPSTYKGYPVTEISWAAFRNCNKLTSVYIPDSVTAINPKAFEYCTKLKSIRFPKKLSYIGSYAFYECKSLQSVSFPKTLKKIGKEVFYRCDSLQKITVAKENPVYESSGNCLSSKKTKTLIRGTNTGVIPKGIQTIEEDAFRNCTGLKTVTIPDGVTTIGESAFLGCTGLQKVALPNTITSIGNSTFSGCTGLQSVSLPAGIDIIGSGTFSDCTSLSSVQIPHGIKRIWYSAFWNCRSLTSLFIPESVTDIAPTAFWSCGGLESIRVSKQNKIFTDKDNCLIHKERKELIIGCKNSVIPSDGSVTAIGMSAFEGCTSLTAITIPKTITSIGYRAFANCPRLVSMTVEKGNKVYTAKGNCLIDKKAKTLTAGCKNSVIPTDGSVTIISEGAFYGCTTLKKLTIPDTVTTIKYFAFRDCTGLKTVTLSPSLRQIGEGAFYNCTGLKRVYFQGTEEEWDSVGKVILDDDYPPESAWLDKVVCQKVDVYKMRVGIDVSWGKTPHAKKYVLYRRTGSGQWKKLKTTRARYYLDKTAKKGKTYRYMVKAVTPSTTLRYVSSDKIKR